MSWSGLLIANRGEIAIRIARAASELGIRTVGVYSEDDADSLHTRRVDDACPLSGVGPAAYLDVEQIITVAKEAGCEAIHPGYGFLSEDAAFARRCAEEGITCVGPRTEMLELFGDKARARAVADQHGVPVLRGTSDVTSVEEARAFLAALEPGAAMIIKAVGGGGGRGVRVVRTADEIEEAYARCQSEAQAAFGNGDLYVEEFLPQARHIEVQVLADTSGEVCHLGERDCSVQRRHQKLIEIAPSPWLAPALHQQIIDAAIRLAQAVRYDNIGTFEFLVDASAPPEAARFAFIEANARLQVEHTVTEEVTGVDIVQTQLQLAAGATLAELGVQQAQVPAPRGFAIQARVNMETMQPDGSVLPTGGAITAFEVPAGPGVRTDSFGYAGYRTSPRFDSLLAKVIAHSPSADFADVVRRIDRALAEFRIDGVASNIPFLRSVFAHSDFKAGRAYTRFIDEHAAQLVEAMPVEASPAFIGPAIERVRAGADIDRSDPLAVLAYGKSASAARSETATPSSQLAPDGTIAVPAPLQGTIVLIDVRPGDQVRVNQRLLVIESMKMEHEILALTSGIVRQVLIAVGDTVYQGHPLVFLEEAEVEGAATDAAAEVDLDEIRPDLREVLDRVERTLDRARPKAVARRRATGQRTARENIEDLCDPGTFLEYGQLVFAAQRHRRTVEDLIDRSPADGIVLGLGTVNGDLFEEPASRAVVMSYDYTVFAGTQGKQNHHKTDRLIEIAERERLPLIIFTEGGGGRPGDVDSAEAGGGGSDTFAAFPQLSAWVPLVGITSGRCFAGNASLLGCCDVIIATAGANIGMGGPAMIEGGGLGVYAPEEIGPMDVQIPNGVVDIAVADEAEAVRVARKYLSYFQGRLSEWEAPDQRLMRRLVPENRLRVYDIRKVIETIADVGSVLELRRDFGVGIVTSLIRIEGRPVGVIANNPAHLGGAIDSDGSDKGARFMQLCDAFDIPILSFSDTPGIMVGPEIEKTALVRHSSRMFVIGSTVSVPIFSIILRKSYGLGAIAMTGGSRQVPHFSISWPTGEFGGMGLEGAVKLGYRNELADLEDPEQRRALYEELVAKEYERGKALNQASNFVIDDTIDPADSRRWVAGLLSSLRPPPPRDHKKRPAIDTW